MAIDTNSLTIGEAKQLAALFSNANPATTTAWEIGECYLIRTVTMIDTGRLLEVTPHEIVLTDAAWIADTGRFSAALKSMDFNEIEPFPDGKVIVGRGAIIDAIKIKSVQRSQK